MVGGFKDLTGRTFGRLTAIERAGKDKHGNILWLCRCECGNTKVVSSTHLRRAHTRSCGCLEHESKSTRKLKNTIGEKYGSLTIVARAENSKYNKSRWLCRCDCGNEIVVEGYSLRKGNIRSCGCLLKRAKKCPRPAKDFLIDMKGKRFGRWEVIDYYGKDKHDGALWLCKCDCGTVRVVNGSALRSGKSTSCGCYNNERIRNLRSQDLAGKQFGYLTVIERTNKRSSSGSVKWRCRCKCGKETFVDTHSLNSGHTRSCGCLAIETTKALKLSHGLSHTHIYYIWQAMKDRCENPNSTAFDYYGGRGIKVCERWHDFENFYEDVSKLEHFGEEGYSLDRIDFNGDYCPENCRWATAKQQANNQRRYVKVTYNGEKMTIEQATTKLMSIKNLCEKDVIDFANQVISSLHPEGDNP